MSRRKPAPPYIEEIARRQKNTTWHEAFANSRLFEERIWKGAANPPLVQRIGFAIFGAAFVPMGCVIAYLGSGTPVETIVATAFGLVWILAGLVLLKKAFG
jgi:hypothetical protein